MKGKITIDKELCKGCSFCVITCPQKIIFLDDKFNQSGYLPACAGSMDKCTGCALCAEMCPEIAIKVWRSKK
ncbi:MAG: 4Fe-4S dicluster domain-containing protein [Nitrospirae bacterium]|nr:4Fe-4S dicluster domain-containing protein [Nitrospirota bacterium]